MDLRAILEESMRGYTVKGMNGYTYLTINDDKTRYAVIAIADDNKPRPFPGIAAHLEQDSIVIYHDGNNKSLVQNGVPRDKIVLAYVGETLATAD